MESIIRLYTICESLFLFFLAFLPLSDHGKWATGIMKKEFDGSAIPANILYQAMNAAMIPKAPPARVKGTFGAPPLFLASKYEHPRQMKASQTIINRLLKATVDLSVQSQTRKVKMNQAKI